MGTLRQLGSVFSSKIQKTKKFGQTIKYRPKIRSITVKGVQTGYPAKNGAQKIDRLFDKNKRTIESREETIFDDMRRVQRR